MPWTPLHASLGETDETLTFALVERACVEGVAERTDLDWKSQLPLTAPKSDASAKQNQQLELAKDIAAMANSGGGMVVFGVAETTRAGTSAADTIVPVGVVDESTTRNIRLVAGNLIYPPVVGLELTGLAPPGDPAGGVLAMVVPGSLDRPHLVHPSNGTDWFGAPYRHGPDTDWMVERQLAAAFSEREAGRRRRVVEFEARFDEFMASLPGATELRWVVALAVPDQPVTRPRAVPADWASGRASEWGDSVIEAAWKWVRSRNPRIGPAELTRDEVTRRGLRRVVRSGRRSLPWAASAIARTRIEVHDDGAVAVAFTRDGAIVGEGRQYTQVPTGDIESTAVDFFALLGAARDVLGVTGDFTARLTVHPPTQIFRIADPAYGDHYRPWDEDRRIYGWRHVDATLTGTAGPQELATSWVEVVTDTINQAGSTTRVDPADLASAARPAADL